MQRFLFEFDVINEVSDEVFRMPVNTLKRMRTRTDLSLPLKQGQRIDCRFTANLQKTILNNNNLIKLFKTGLELMPSDEYKVIIRADETRRGKHKICTQKT